MVNDTEYVCIEQQQLSKHSEELTELKARAEFKERRLDDLNNEIQKIDKKLDSLDNKLTDLMMKSVQDDNNLNQRVTSLENTVQVLRWVVTLLFGSGVIWIIITHWR